MWMGNQQHIQESFGQFSRLVNNVAEVLYSASLEGPIRMEFINSRIESITGFDAEQICTGRIDWMELVHTDDRSGLLEAYENCKHTGKGFELEYRIVKKDGNICDVFDRAVPVFDDNGHICGIDGMITEITERKELLRKLQYSRSRYRKMVDNVPGIVYQFGLQPDGAIEFLFMSDRCREMFGIEPERIMRDSSILISRIEHEDRAEFYHQVAISSEKFTTHHWCGRVVIAGQTKWFQSIASPERLDNGSIIWDGLMLDVTHNKELEDEVKRIAKFPGQNPNPVMRVSNDGTIIYANSASKTLLDLWGSKIGHRIPGNVYEIVHSVIDSGLHDSVEISCGDTIFNIVFAPVNEYNYVSLYARDVTEIKNTEMELIKTNQILVEHDRLKSEFVSTVSHELRTPLFIFKNIISNAMAGVMGKISSRLYENLRIADMSVERLAKIISDLLDISKIESGTMELSISGFSIHTFVEEVAKSLLPLAEVKKITIETHIADDQLIVVADRDKIAQILTNLVGNAIKFIPVSGNVDIKVTAAVDNNVTISVCDDGPGLSAEESRQIFDRFVQGEILRGEGYHGTGLGLTIAKNLVELHGGKMWLETSHGNGCQFHFTIPVSAEQGQPQEDMELVAG